MNTMIHLREYQQNDIDSIVTLANNKKVAQYLSDTFPHPYTQKDAEWWITTGCKKGINLAIEWNGQYVGGVGAVPREGEKRYTAVVGYWVGEPFWGKGITHQALVQLTQNIFANTDIVRLEASVYHPNHASMRVLEKAGYWQEAILEQAIYKNGEFYNEHIFIKLKRS